ncbi:ankyrin 2,3/unc44 [Fusarium sporotrichioides]|uniref:Ankyrin 2,3/unc44 n=1 Tax=Fusarium sporotrichioides TaxID=5514 RepID=A0A395RS78_FUSSP|nr:ankyrin 2,3/unc44 [Fusarium sporotrichioides]
MSCRRGRTDLLKPLLENRATINVSKGPSALLEASVHTTSRALKILLKSDSNVSPKNNHGLTALALACRYGRLDKVRVLIRMKAGILGKPDNAINAGLLHGFDEMPAAMSGHLQAIMYWTVRANSLALVEKCIKASNKLPLPELSVATWLHVVAKVGHHEMIDRFFSHIDPSDKVAGDKTALHLAVVNGTSDTAQTLLGLVQKQKDAKAKVEAILALDDSGESPLSLAVTRKSGAHKELAGIFWGELAVLVMAQYRDFQLKTEHVSGVLETLARYERPGPEYILKDAFKQRVPAGTVSVPELDSWSALAWAV